MMWIHKKVSDYPTFEVNHRACRLQQNIIVKHYETFPMSARKWHALNLMVRANANVACFFSGHEGLMEAQQTSL